MKQTEEITIYFAINDSYWKQLYVAMTSICKNCKNKDIVFNIVSSDLATDTKDKIKEITKLKRRGNTRVAFHKVPAEMYDDLNLNISYISRETYYRFVIPEFEKTSDKVIYLDADLVVKGDIYQLWTTELGECYAAGVEDTYIKDIGYKDRIGFKEGDLYVNAGVLLLNVKKIKEENKVSELFRIAKEPPFDIEYQDQDVINIVFKGAIKKLPGEFNYTFRDVICNPPSRLLKACIVHFTGEKKPWDYIFESNNPAEIYYWRYLFVTPYRNDLIDFLKDRENLKFLLKNRVKWFLRHARSLLSRVKAASRNICTIDDYSNGADKERRKIKVALLIDEFFGGSGTAFGGYGFLARRYIAKYIPCDDIQIDVLLGIGKKYSLQVEKVDNVNVYKLSSSIRQAKKWLLRQNYDVYLSIELTSSSYEILRLDDRYKKLVLWIQDPRPWYEWREINTVKLFPETCYWDTRVYEYVNYLNWKRQVRFITQGKFLENKARDLYRLNNDLQIEYVPNPVDIDEGFDLNVHKKKDQIIFLGRIESVKRGWLFCEIAKRMPEYQFYMLGQTFREKGKNSAIMRKYNNIKNLSFVGHVDGDEKAQFLKDSKILINTSIHEALPVSFLEALAYGTVLVSNRNPEDLTNKFGIWIGDVYGDGFDKVELYVNAIRELMSNEDIRIEKAERAIEYVKRIHSKDKFIKTIRNILREEAGVDVTTNIDNSACI